MVFVSHELRADGCVKLARECVDVGVGVERTLAVINQSFDVYKEIGADDASLAAAFGTGFGRSLRTVVDHLRCASFIAFEGTTPAATGAGYVLRKLVRRSVTEIMTSSPAPDALAAFKTLASLVIDSRRAVDSATAASKSKILRVLALEAKVFVDSLARGMRRALKFNGAGGLHATHGVPKALVGTVASCVTYATPVKAVVSARCERALALTKTSVHAGVGRQVGGVGVVVSATGSAYVQRGALHHTILCESGEALASGQNVWVVSNDFVTSMTACAHTGLHALLALASRFVMGVNLKSTSVSYLGFCFEAAVDGAPLVVCALAQLLKLADVGVTTCV